MNNHDKRSPNNDDLVSGKVHLFDATRNLMGRLLLG